MKKRDRVLSWILASTMLMNGMVLAGPMNAAAEESNEAPYFTSGKWIWSSSTVQTNSISYFRREFQFKSTPVSINIKTSAHNYLKFYFNGQIMTGLCTPASTVVPENKYYLEYTLSGDKLTGLLDKTTPTQAVFASMVQYLGSSNGQNYVMGKPGFWASITVKYADGSTQALETDNSWYALADTPYLNGTPGQESRNLSAVLDYDARKMPDPLAFAKNGYVMSSYTAGQWVKAVPADSETATWKMRPQGIPEGVVHKVITPTPVATQTDTVKVYDTGLVVSGFVHIKMKATAGTRICLRYSERLTSAGRVEHTEGGEISDTYCDYYTFTGNGTEEYCPDFVYKAFRYAEFEVLSGSVTSVEAFDVEWASTGISSTASFSSSDDIMNKIYQACVNTQVNNVQNMPVDCPHREQSQYLGDSQMQYELLSYAFTDFDAINEKLLRDFADEQFPNGSFPFVAPVNYAAYTYGSSYLIIPEYDLHYPDMLYQYYYHSGKTDALKEFYNAAKKVSDYYYGYVDSTGLAAKTPYWHIADWPSCIVDVSGKYLSTYNLYLYDALNKTSKIATLLGKTDDAAFYAQRAQKLGDAITERLMDYKTGLYMDCSGSSLRNPGVTALAIYVGQSPASFREKQLDYIAKTMLGSNFLQARIFLSLPVFHDLMQGNDEQKQAVYTLMTRTNAQGWGEMVASGDQTVWEDFDYSTGSHSHAYAGYPARIALQYLAGIGFAKEGCGGVTVKPFLPQGQSFVQGSVQLPSGGSVSSRLEKTGDTSRLLTVGTPVAARIGVPRFAMQNTQVTLDGTVLFEDGAAKGSVSGIAYAGNDSQYVYFDVQPGTRAFSSSVKAPAAAGSYTLSVSAGSGGTVQQNGGAISLPYTSAVTSGEQVKLTAVPENGMKFAGWSGSYGSDTAEFDFSMQENVTLHADFVKDDEVYYKTVSIDAPKDSGLSVLYNGRPYSLPATLLVKQGASATLTVQQAADSRYTFLAWTGDVFDARQTVTLDVQKDIQLTVRGEYRAKANLALHAAVSSNNGISAGTAWQAANLTDGFITAGPGGQLGYTSGAYSGADISATPNVITIDLGANRSFDHLVIYPRADQTDMDGGSVCFPESYSVQVCPDGGTTYTTAAEVKDGGNPRGVAQTVSFARQTARYVKIVTTKLGEPVPEGSSDVYRVQLTEIEVYSSATAQDSFTLKINAMGNGNVKLNGQIVSLPFSKAYPGGTKLRLEAAEGKNYSFTGWTGSVSAGVVPVDLQMNGDYSMTANFTSLPEARSDNLALGKQVTAKEADGGAPVWSPQALTDGATVVNSTTVGYTSKAHAGPDVSAGDAPWVEIDLGKNTDFSELALYPRTGVTGMNGGTESPNFPEGIKIEGRKDGETGYNQIGSWQDVANPQGKPLTLYLGSQNARYLRITATRLGSSAADEAGVYRFQLCETELYDISDIPVDPVRNIQVTADQTSVDLSGTIHLQGAGGSGIVWSLQTPDGSVSSLAALTGTDTATPTLQPLASGTVYVVARFDDEMYFYDRLAVTITDKAALKAAYDENALLRQSQYSPETWAPFADALAKAGQVLTNSSAAQSEIDTALAALNTAAANLKPAAGPGSSTPAPSEGDNGNSSQPASQGSSSGSGGASGGSSSNNSGDPGNPGTGGAGEAASAVLMLMLSAGFAFGMRKKRK